MGDGVRGEGRGVEGLITLLFISVFIKIIQSFPEAIYMRKFPETTGEGVPCFSAIVPKGGLVS